MAISIELKEALREWMNGELICCNINYNAHYMLESKEMEINSRMMKKSSTLKTQLEGQCKGLDSEGNKERNKVIKLLQQEVLEEKKKAEESKKIN